jgi:glycine/D-amino acid oxidase-like deaminating enzyme
MHVVVVGAGIVGMAAATFLARAGAKVTVVEAVGIASAASGANSGMVYHPFEPALNALYHPTLALYRELALENVGFTLDVEPAGILLLGHGGDAAGVVAQRIRALYPSIPVDLVQGPALEGLEPGLAPGLTACRVGIGFPVAPGSAAYAFATLAERHGAVVRAGRSAALLRAADGSAEVLVDGQHVAADAVIVAAGPWTPEVLDPTGRWRPIVRRWGVVVEMPLPRPPHHILEDAVEELDVGVVEAVPGDWTDGDSPGFSLVPTPRLASVGSTFLATEPDPDAWVERILVQASSFLPAVADAPIRGTRCCPRPQSVDGRPLVGRVPGWDNVFVCAGHGSWGISTGPGSARLVADLVLGGSPRIDPVLDPARFGIPGG